MEYGVPKAGDVLDAKMHVFVEGNQEAALVVSTTARVSKPMELLPAVLHLPRRSSSGPVDSGTVSCRATGGAAPTIRAGSVPSGLSVRVSEATSGTGYTTVVVEADPKAARAESLIPLTARSGDREYSLSLRVVIEQPEP